MFHSEYFSLGIVPLLAGFAMVCAGYYLYKYPPKNINGTMGYRTQQSMKSQDAWNYAQRYAAQLMMKWGLFAMVTSLPLGYFHMDYDTTTVLVLLIVLISTTAPILQVEKRLTEFFS